MIQPKGRESRFTMTREQNSSNFNPPKMRILGREEDLKISTNAHELQKHALNFSDKNNLESLTSSQQPIKMDKTKRDFKREKVKQHRFIRSKSHLTLSNKESCKNVPMDRAKGWECSS